MSSSSPPPLPTVTRGSDSTYITSAAHLLARAFEHDALERYVTLVSDSIPNSTIFPLSRHERHFLSGTIEKVRSGAILEEAGGWGAVSIWYPPGVEDVFSDVSGLVQPMVELYSKFGVVKKKWLRGRRHWYLNLVARDPRRREKGLVRALVEPYIKKAAEENVPIWIEATTKHSRDVYEYLGFKEVEKIFIGEGKADKLGNVVEGGKGIVVYCMIIEPPGVKAQ